VKEWTRTWARLAVVLGLLPAPAIAQPAPPAAGVGEAAQTAGSSNIWFVAGGAFAAIRGDCQTCEEDSPYRSSGGVLADIGYRVNSRMDVGAEVFWTSTETASGHIRATHLDAVAQFRPWRSKGFFVKGGAGMAFVRNWVDVVGPDAINSKALSVVVGAGWAFRPAERFGVQLFGAQHAGALGDLQTSESEIQDVMGNFWSLVAAVVIR
jgi:hypothetical protein